MKKKIVSLMLTGVLLAGMPMTVSAATTTQDFTNKGTVPTPNSTNVEVEGEITFIDKVIYEVTLPTNKAFEFAIDPQGLLGTADATTYPDGTEGLIVATEGKGAFVKNSSSVPVKITVDAYVSKSTGTSAFAASSVNLLSLEQADSVNSGIDNNMLIAFDITHDDATVATEADIKTENVNPQVIAIETNGKSAVTDVGTVITFALDKANYKYDSSDAADPYKLDTANPGGDTVGMRVSGFLNTNADWSAYGKVADSKEPIIVKALYKFDALNVDYEAAALDGRAHGTLEDVMPEYYAGADETAARNPIAATEALEYTVGTEPLTIDFNLGSGKDEVTIDSIKAGGAGSEAAIDATSYKVYNNQIVFKTTATDVNTNIIANAEENGKDINVIITTSDTKETTVKVKVFKAAE